MLLLTVGASTTRSGAGAAPTVTVTASGAVVPGIGFATDALDAGAVVVGPGAGRGGQADRLGTGTGCGKDAHRVGADFGIDVSDRRVGRAIVAQGGGRRLAGSLVADGGVQGERSPGGRPAVADRWGIDDQVGSRCGAHGDGHGSGAVVPGIGFATDALDAGAVVVGPGAGRGGQADRLGTGTGCA